ncbi:hypothetical protein E0H65_22580 [Rhizobium leguminosarum bv. viciae]|nr:hypothetical protein E0H65_22580 [Rhizobium leguminosarum bv. viciae]
MEIFKASVQYGDWQGTASADDGHDIEFQSFLKDKGLIGEGAYAVAIRFYNGENFDKPSVRVVVADGTGHDDVNAQINASGILRFKELEVELSLEEFFNLFKRFSIVLMSRDLGLEGREYEIIE